MELDPAPTTSVHADTRAPRRKAPKGAKWLGKWKRVAVSTYTTNPDGSPSEWVDRHAWTREYLELDGHEQCCRHVWPVFIFDDVPLDIDGDEAPGRGGLGTPRAVPAPPGDAP